MQKESVKNEKLNLTKIQIAWLAGLFEGEASFTLDKRAKKRYAVSTAPPNVSVKIVLNDEDVIQTVANLLDKNVYLPKRLTIKNNQTYGCSIGDRNTLLYLLPRIYPYMGKRRKAQLDPCLKALNNWVIWFNSGGRSKMAKKRATGYIRAERIYR
uniref:Putative LAGLIDADG homing endonuclease n=1 Tax=Neodangemannia microcystis TaxID=173495 RepID=A0A1W6EHD6_9CHLO|nr:putative LAGLIDADG homing endonuclease [Neodangemannia microcystis]ARK14811.1 putative LAGLIDADG homing endonuclease [Neodangemannia microcystis]